MKVSEGLILKLALKRIKDAFAESEVSSIYISEKDIILELKSGRTFALSNIEVEYQASEMINEITDI